MTTAYYSTHDLCERFRCSSRTLFRRMRRAVNPLPAPAFVHIGSCNLWDASEVAAWELRERERTRLRLHPAINTALTVGGPL